jgi:hypothetical protein
MLVVEINYLHDSKVFFSVVLGPHSIMGGVGGLSPPQLFPGGPWGRGDNFSSPPLVGDLGEMSPKQKYWENFLVKYCNFMVNMDRSL